MDSRTLENLIENKSFDPNIDPYDYVNQKYDLVLPRELDSDSDKTWYKLTSKIIPVVNYIQFKSLKCCNNYVTYRYHKRIRLDKFGNVIGIYINDLNSNIRVDSWDISIADEHEVNEKLNNIKSRFQNSYMDGRRVIGNNVDMYNLHYGVEFDYHYDTYDGSIVIDRYLK